MTRYFFLILFLFFLAACDAPASPDLYRAISDAEAARDAASAQLTATRQAQNDRDHQATLRAAETAGAVQAEIDLLSARLAATQTAAEIEMGLARATEDALRLQATMDQAQAWVRASETVAAAQTATAAPLTETPKAATQEAIVRLTEREEARERWYPLRDALSILAPPLLFLAVALLFILAAILAYKRFAPVAEIRARQVSRGPGSAPVYYHQAGNNIIVVDPNKAASPALMLGSGGAILSGMAAEYLQAQILHDDALVRVIGNYPQGHTERREARQLVEGELLRPSEPAAPEIIASPVSLPDVAPWGMFRAYQGQGLPLGLGAQGLIVADPEHEAHLMVAGTTGSGKTRLGLRPIVAGALASGWQVAIFDSSGLDFLPFRDHPNCRLVILEEPTQAIAYLLAMYQEIRRRFRILAGEGISTWGRLPQAGPRILGVFDEFSNLADGMSAADREELWRSARMVAAEGRKAGIHLAIALQDPTHKSIDLRIRRNMSRIAFRVRDGAASRVVLNADGAENLPPRRFLALMGIDMTEGVAFAPGDDDLSDYLDGRGGAILAEPEWLLAPPREREDPDEKERRIRELAGRGWPLRKIQQEIYGYTGGAAYNQVRAVLDDDTTSTSSSTDTEVAV